MVSESSKIESLSTTTNQSSWLSIEHNLNDSQVTWQQIMRSSLVNNHDTPTSNSDATSGAQPNNAYQSSDYSIISSPTVHLFTPTIQDTACTEQSRLGLPSSLTFDMS